MIVTGVTNGCDRHFKSFQYIVIVTEMLISVICLSKTKGVLFQTAYNTSRSLKKAGLIIS